MGEDYVIDQDNDVFIMYSPDSKNKFSGSGVCLSKLEMNSYFKSGLKDLKEQGILMAIWESQEKMDSTGYPGYPSGKILVKIPVNGSYVTYGSFKKMMKSKDTKEWYLLPIYGGKRRRVGNLQGSYGTSKNHGQIPGFQINKAYAKEELKDGLVIKETNDDFPKDIKNLKKLIRDLMVPEHTENKCILM